MKNAQIPIAMIGGGPGSLIGAAHREALRVANSFDLVAGCFSRSLAKSESIQTQLQKPLRLYADWQTMLKKEALLGTKTVLIATPDHLHFEQAKMALEHDFHVIVDKPLCRALDAANTLFTLALKRKKRLELTYTYAGNPTYNAFAKKARSVLQGTSFQISARFITHWANTHLEENPQHPMHMQSWRFRSKQGCGALGDIAVHIFEYSRRLIADEPLCLSAVLQKTIAARECNDGGTILIRYPRNNLLSLQFSLALVADDYYCVNVHTPRHALHFSMGRQDYTVTDETQTNTVMVDSNTFERKHDSASPAQENEPETNEARTVESFANLYRVFAARITAKEVYSEKDRATHAGLCGVRLIDRVMHATETKTWIDW